MPSWRILSKVYAQREGNEIGDINENNNWESNQGYVGVRLILPPESRKGRFVLTVRADFPAKSRGATATEPRGSVRVGNRFTGASIVTRRKLTKVLRVAHHVHVDAAFSRFFAGALLNWGIDHKHHKPNRPQDADIQALHGWNEERSLPLSLKNNDTLNYLL